MVSGINNPLLADNSRYHTQGCIYVWGNMGHCQGAPIYARLQFNGVI